MTPATRAYITGLHLAAHACAHIARTARESGDTQTYLTRSRHAATLAEDARIVAGDTEALLDRTERVLDQGWQDDRVREYELLALKRDVEKDAIAGALMALRGQR